MFSKVSFNEATFVDADDKLAEVLALPVGFSDFYGSLPQKMSDEKSKKWH